MRAGRSQHQVHVCNWLLHSLTGLPTRRKSQLGRSHSTTVLIRLAQSPNASGRHCTGLLTGTRARSASVFSLNFPLSVLLPYIFVRAKNYRNMFYFL